MLLSVYFCFLIIVISLFIFAYGKIRNVPTGVLARVLFLMSVYLGKRAY